MKAINRIALGAIMALGASVPALAGPFQIGPVVGMNINSVNIKNFSDNFSAENRCGFAGGVMAKVTIPVVNIGVDLSALYEYRQMQMTVAGLDAEKINYSYIAVPLHVRYDVPMPAISKVFFPTIYTGPNFAFNIGKDIIKDYQTKKFDLGWDFGLGITLCKHLQISAAYTLGITKAINYVGKLPSVDDPEVQGANINGKTSGWTVSAAWLF